MFSNKGEKEVWSEVRHNDIIADNNSPIIMEKREVKYHTAIQQ